MCHPMLAHCRHLANMTELVLPSAHPSAQPKRQINRSVQRFLHNSRQSVVGYIGATWRIRLKLCTLAASGKYGSTCASFGPPESTTQTANRSVQLFHHSSRQKVHILNNGRPFPPKLPLLMGIWTPSNSWFLGPVQAHNLNSIMIGSAIFSQVTAVFQILYIGLPTSPSKLPILMGDLDPI